MNGECGVVWIENKKVAERSLELAYRRDSLIDSENPLQDEIKYQALLYPSAAVIFIDARLEMAAFQAVTLFKNLAVIHIENCASTTDDCHKFDPENIHLPFLLELIIDPHCLSRKLRFLGEQLPMLRLIEIGCRCTDIYSTSKFTVIDEFFVVIPTLETFKISGINVTDHFVMRQFLHNLNDSVNPSLLSVHLANDFFYSFFTFWPLIQPVDIFNLMLCDKVIINSPTAPKCVGFHTSKKTFRNDVVRKRLPNMLGALANQKMGLKCTRIFHLCNNISIE